MGPRGRTETVTCSLNEHCLSTFCILHSGMWGTAWVGQGQRQEAAALGAVTSPGEVKQAEGEGEVQGGRPHQAGDGPAAALFHGGTEGPPSDPKSSPFLCPGLALRLEVSRGWSRAGLPC